MHGCRIRQARLDISLCLQTLLTPAAKIPEQVSSETKVNAAAERTPSEDSVSLIFNGEVPKSVKQQRLTAFRYVCQSSHRVLAGLIRPLISEHLHAQQPLNISHVA